VDRHDEGVLVAQAPPGGLAAGKQEAVVRHRLRAVDARPERAEVDLLGRRRSSVGEPADDPTPVWLGVEEDHQTAEPGVIADVPRLQATERVEFQPEFEQARESPQHQRLVDQDTTRPEERREEQIPVRRIWWLGQDG
jgi:hypothetical protein